MPEAKVYLCDKTEGLKGEHRKCGREVGDDGVTLILTIGKANSAEEDERLDLRFCGRAHTQYWLIRQRLGPGGTSA